MRRWWTRLATQVGEQRQQQGGQGCRQQRQTRMQALERGPRQPAAAKGGQAQRSVAEATLLWRAARAHLPAARPPPARCAQPGPPLGTQTAPRSPAISGTPCNAATARQNRVKGVQGRAYVVAGATRAAIRGTVASQCGPVGSGGWWPCSPHHLPTQARATPSAAKAKPAHRKALRTRTSRSVPRCGLPDTSTLCKQPGDEQARRLTRTQPAQQGRRLHVWPRRDAPAGPRASWLSPLAPRSGRAC